MKWSTASAREKFADLVAATSEGPQQVYNRGRLVAVVLDPATFAEFESWRSARGAGSIADAFADLRRLAGEDGWELPVPARVDRAEAEE